MSSYQIEVKLDLGDIGEVDATVDGSVVESGLFGPGNGYMEPSIEKVIAHIPLAPGARYFNDFEVTLLLSDISKVLICEGLEREHESQRRGA